MNIFKLGILFQDIINLEYLIYCILQSDFPKNPKHLIFLEENAFFSWEKSQLIVFLGKSGCNMQYSKVIY